ncbi:MAG TPA: hypothetical protein VNF99_09415 [Stellaceae bacterium]|nr:hypothetical protein [Stellaceae bacterium]
MTGSTQAKRASRGRSVAVSSLAALAAIVLAGCEDFGGRVNTYTCPATTTVPELQTLALLPPGGNARSIISAGRVNAVTATCDPDGDKGVVSRLAIEFTALRTTPAITHLDLPYFVALADSAGNILGKRLFVVRVDFALQTPVAKSTDDVTVHLPLRNEQLGNIYTLVVGFQLNRSQLDYNRAHLQ